MSKTGDEPTGSMASDPDTVEPKTAADMADPSLARCLDAVAASEGSLTQLIGSTTPEDGSNRGSNVVVPLIAINDQVVPAITVNDQVVPDVTIDDQVAPVVATNDQLEPFVHINIDADSSERDTASATISLARRPGIGDSGSFSRGIATPHSDRSRGIKCCGINWCNWFPKMCCVDSGGTRSPGATSGVGLYEPLDPTPTLFELSLNHLLQDRSAEGFDPETQEELQFFTEDGRSRKVIVEKNLCASDLCQLLALKNRVAYDVSWTVSESWHELGIERNLEDHEDVFSVHRDMVNFAPEYERRFMFRKDFRKYEFFLEPMQFFPPEMVDFTINEFRGIFTDRKGVLQRMLHDTGKCPPVFSLTWLLDPIKKVWSKIWMVTHGKKLYFTPKVKVVSRVMRQWRHRSESQGDPGALLKKLATANLDELQVLAHLSDYHIYTTLNAIRDFKAPTEWGICLRPSSRAETEDTSTGVLRCLAFETEEARTCWIIAMRLAKYGKQLKENYRAFKNKQCEQSKEQYRRYAAAADAAGTRVAMDFTGKVGRIVNDPKEVLAITNAEGDTWSEKAKRTSRIRLDRRFETKKPVRSVGIHSFQPWFHGDLTRKEATELLQKHGTVDGVFLVRHSGSNAGFVVTYKSRRKVIHGPIQEVKNEHDVVLYYTMDHGRTRFYDLAQLVRFHKLNVGPLQTRLTHYVPVPPVPVEPKAPAPSLSSLPVAGPSTSSATGPSTSSATGPSSSSTAEPSTSSATGPSTSSATGPSSLSAVVPLSSSAVVPSSSSAAGPSSSSVAGWSPSLRTSSSTPSPTLSKPSNM